MPHRVEAGPSTVSRYPGEAVGCCTDTLHGLRSFRMHINGRAISCILILSRQSCDMSERPKRKGQVSPGPLPFPPILHWSCWLVAQGSSYHPWHWNPDHSAVELHRREVLVDLQLLPDRIQAKMFKEENKQFNAAFQCKQQGVRCPRLPTLIISTMYPSNHITTQYNPQPPPPFWHLNIK